jgi:hypothetical protein
MMEGADLSERLVIIYETVRCHNPEKSSHQKLHIFNSSTPNIIRMVKLRIDIGGVYSMHVTDIFCKKTARKDPICKA